MRKRTVAVLVFASAILWWVAEQIIGNWIANYVEQLLPAAVSAAWAGMTGQLIASAILLALALVVVLGVYWLGTVDRNTSTSTGGTTHPGSSIAHGLMIEKVIVAVDFLAGSKKNVQLGVQIQNTTQQIIQFTVDSMFVSLNNQIHPNPAFQNTGGILRPGQLTDFRYDVFAAVVVPKACPAVVDIQLSYGVVERPLTRHLHRGFATTLKFQGKNAQAVWADTSDEDTEI